MGRAGIFVALAALAAAAQPPQAAREEAGYRVLPGLVVVDEAAHWRAWEAADGTRVVADDGVVRPRFVRRDIDAVRNAAEFVNVDEGDTTMGGISAVGTPADSLTALLAIDGDPSTWWEPDASALESAWIEIDLGRTAIARSIRLRFADTGDPFLQFRVLVSDGANTFQEGRARQFYRAGQVAAPNKTQREFTFDLAPRRPVPDGVEGEPVQFVRIDLLGTDGPRAEEVAPDAYLRLAAEDRGAIDFFRVTVAGRQIPVLRESYELLPDAERGPVRHYRRERPRLAEVEVEALGDNIVALTQRALFASGDFFEDLVRRFVTDGLMRTAFPVRVYNPFRDRDQVFVDLGARFWLERIRLISNESPLTSYQLRVSDGSLDPAGGYLWTAFDERVNAERYLEVEELFTPRPVRLLELRRLDLLRDSQRAGRLNELQAFGEGYVSQVVLTSPLIKFDRREVVATVSWEGSEPPGSALELRTRSGDELIQIEHFYDRSGREISQPLHERLADQFRGPIRVEEVVGPDWSPWSEPYPAASAAFRSPSPRRMAQVQARLLTFEPLRAASIRRLQLALVPPLVDRAVAEIWPTQRVTPGQDRDFTLYLRADLAPGDPGFARLIVRSTAAAAIAPTALRLGTDDDLRFGAAATLWPGPAAMAALDAGVAFDLPAGLAYAGRVFELRFRTSVYLPSTTFSAQLEDAAGQRQQQVDPGDASGLVGGSQLVVVSELEGLPLLAPLAVDPAVVTPNGDGANDQLVLGITVFQLEGERSIEVGVYDLRGRRVRDLSFTPPAPSGQHRVTWGGQDDAGRTVPPGTYLVRVRVPTDAGADGAAAIRAVAVAY